MKTKRIIPLILLSFFVVLLVFLIFSKVFWNIDSPLTETLENQTTEEHQSETQEPQEAVSSENTEHQHFWLISSYFAPQCEKDGLRVLSCKCGEKVEETIPGKAHEFEGGSCQTESKCKFCGIKGKKFDHSFEDARCIYCKYEIKAPVYALGQTFYFDESEDSVVSKLGSPTEILTEGRIRSLVYATSSKLTIFQLDLEGLWGVFTMDPNAFFRVDEKVINYVNFSGKKDLNSDATYQIVGPYKIFGFRDGFDQDTCYGLWIYYSDFAYQYGADPEIYEDFRAQNRISFYYVNALRTRHGLTPLAWSEAAAQVSLNYAEKMAKENFFAHDYKCGERLTQAGVVWHSCGENLSQGYINTYFVMDAYYNSKDHRANILNGEFTRLGIGFYRKAEINGIAIVYGAQTYFS